VVRAGPSHRWPLDRAQVGRRPGGWQASGLPRQELQVWLGEHRPELRVDMLVREYATVVEADGRMKYEGPTARPGQAWQDKRRLDRLLELDHDCHRFVHDDVARPVTWGRGLLRTFARSANRRGRPVPVFPYPWA
jgi:hypothetical protein